MDINLGVGLERRDILEENGYNVVMLREDNDTETSSQERAIEAADSGADIFVRLYYRKDQNTSKRGAMMYLPSESNSYIGDLYEECDLLGNSILEKFDSSVLNEYEKENVTFLLKEEKKLMPGGYQLDQPGYSFEEDDGWEDEIAETDEWELYREYFAEESFHEDMKLYHQYVQEQGLNNIIKNIQDEYTEDEILVQQITIADFDQDDRVEIWLSGPGASANAQAAILDIEDGEVECVFSDWGIELGQYDDLETGETGLVIMEGNSEGDYYFHSWLGLYDEDWNQTILCEGMAEGDEGTYYDRDGNEITEDEYGDIWSEISEECRDTDIVFEREQVDMDLDEVLYVLYLAEQGEA